jgi:hypothetical protein
MNPLLQVADEFLAEAKAGIDGRASLTEAEINEYLNSARELIHQGKREVREQAIASAAREAFKTLDYLETVRRLVSYGVAHGRFGGEGIEFCNIFATRPPIDRKGNIHKCTEVFEWLRANRSELAARLEKLVPASN